MKAIDLKGYLQSQASEGALHDPGGFSLSWERAKEQLTKFQLLRDTAWVSLLIQSAVDWTCQKIELTQGRYISRFCLDFGEQQIPSKESLLKALSGALTHARTPEQKFALLMRFLLAKTDPSFEVHLSDKGRIQTLSLGKKKATDRFKKQAKNSLVLDIDHRQSPTVDEVFPLLAVRRTQLEIREELETFSGMCSIPISLDGVPFQGQLYDKEGGDAGERIPRVIDRLVAEETSLMYLPLPQILREADEELHSDLPEENVPGVFSISLRLPHQSESYPPQERRLSSMNWVKSGTIVESLPLKIETKVLCVSLYLSGETLETDLTGFQLQKSSTLDAARQESLRVLAYTLQKAESIQPKLTLSPEVKSRDHQKVQGANNSGLFTALELPLMGVAFILLTCGIPTIFAGGLKFVLAGTGMFATAILAPRPFLKIDKELCVKMDQRIAEDYQLLLSYLQDSP